MRMWNICAFASASEIGALILYFTKLWEFKKTGKHCKYFCLLYKNFKSKQKISPFLNNPTFSSTPPFLEKIFHPHTYCQIRGTQSPLWEFELWPIFCNYFFQFQKMINIFEKHFWVTILVNQYEICFGCNPASGISLKNCCLLAWHAGNSQHLRYHPCKSRKKRLPWLPWLPCFVTWYIFICCTMGLL